MKETEILNNIAAKLGIEELNPMQRTMAEKYNTPNIILLSPTGSGKTVAFTIPVLKSLRPAAGNVQAVVIAPSRELAQQIWKVVQAVATDYKATCCYGGHSFEDEKKSLAVTPDIIVSTPGRLLDHLKRGDIDIYKTRVLVLDEFDKSLDLGFHDEMERIVKRMPNLARRILTSATPLVEFPAFLRMDNAETLSFLSDGAVEERIEVAQVESPEKDKLAAALELLNNIDDGKAILFVNHRDAAERVYAHLRSHRLPVGFYHGGMEQIDREKAIAMLNNGTYKIIVTTDLGARGLDIANIDHIIHYHLPVGEEAYIHRNGRTARVEASGKVYVITSPGEKIPDFIKFDTTLTLDHGAACRIKRTTETLFFSAGKKEKISRADIVGFLLAKSGLQKEEIGKIDVADHYAMAAVPAGKAAEVLSRIEKEKIKNKKVKISVARR